MLFQNKYYIFDLILILIDFLDLTLAFLCRGFLFTPKPKYMKLKILLFQMLCAIATYGQSDDEWHELISYRDSSGSYGIHFIYRKPADTYCLEGHKKYPIYLSKIEITIFRGLRQDGWWGKPIHEGFFQDYLIDTNCIEFKKNYYETLVNRGKKLAKDQNSWWYQKVEETKAEINGPTMGGSITWQPEPKLIYSKSKDSIILVRDHGESTSLSKYDWKRILDIYKIAPGIIDTARISREIQSFYPGLNFRDIDKAPFYQYIKPKIK